MQPLRSIKIQTVRQNDLTKSDHGDDSTMSFCFWATVKVLIKYLRTVFLSWISALMPPNQVHHSCSHQKCINLCCNSVCRAEKRLGYMPQRWQFNGSPNNLSPGGGISACFMAWKARGDHFQNTFEKKIGNDSIVEECSDHQKMPILWELPLNVYTVYSLVDCFAQPNRFYCIVNARMSFSELLMPSFYSVKAYNYTRTI